MIKYVNIIINIPDQVVLRSHKESMRQYLRMLPVGVTYVLLCTLIQKNNGCEVFAIDIMEYEVLVESTCAIVFFARLQTMLYTELGFS